MAQSFSEIKGRISAKNEDVAVAQSGNTTLLELDVTDQDEMGVLFTVAGQDLDAFVVEAKVHPTHAYATITSAITSTPGGIVIAASGTLATTAAAGTGWALLDVRPFVAIKISASSGNVAGSTVDAYAFVK